MHTTATTAYPNTAVSAKYRHALPQLANRVFMTDGGLETTIVYQEGIELPCFAAFDLFKDAAGRAILDRYFRTYIAIARRNRAGFILESATWRANPDWATKIGYSDAGLAEVNRAAIAMLHDLRAELETPESPMVISGCVGPRGDGYKADRRMTVREAADYHAAQIGIFAAAGADVISAITMTYAEEATGIVQAAQAVGMPVVISFTVETDGRLPSGQSLADAIAQVDRETAHGPAYYMINCAHPTHFESELHANAASWVKRIRGIRANASCRSHAELDTATELDSGNPAELGAQYRALRDRWPQLNVLGGCCGTDHRHIEAIGLACAH
jgi:S-methylmethionine-dependent homocysteine/selenocysteine methylase